MTNFEAVEKHEAALLIDPTYAKRVNDKQWASYDGTKDWDMDAAFIAAVQTTEPIQSVAA